jgi:hypothetical protein
MLANRKCGRSMIRNPERETNDESNLFVFRSVVGLCGR